MASKSEFCHLSKFKLLKKIKLPNGSAVSSIAVTNDNRLILGDYENRRLSSWTETGRHLKDCALGEHPFGIAIISDTDEAVVTLPDASLVQFVNTNSMKLGKVMHVPEHCYGITVLGHKIVLGGFGKVYFINMAGECLTTLNVGSSYLYPLCHAGRDTLYCCVAFNDHTLYSVKHDGTIIFTYTSKDFNGPSGVAIDNDGNLYVTAWKSNNVHLLSPNGTLLNVILTEQDGLRKPSGIAFNKTRTKLYIPNKDVHDPNMMIFSCSQQK